MIPVFDNRQIIGHAATAKAAARLIKKSLQNIPKGWKVSVKARNTSVIDLPAGWVYSIHP